MNIFKDWDHKVELGDLHEAREAGELSVGQVASRFAERLEKIEDEELQADLAMPIADLKCIAEDEDDDNAQDEYNEILAEIYDIGDAGKRLWINSI